jgi:hypothetical protein
MNPTNNEQIMDFEDDETVLFETKICYESYLSIELIILTPAFLFFLYLYSTSKYNFYFGIFPLCLGLLVGYLSYLAYQKYQIFIKKEPQILLNRDGMQTAQTKFHTWDKIQNIDIILDSKKYYLVYEYEGGKENFFLTRKAMVYKQKN